MAAGPEIATEPPVARPRAELELETGDAAVEAGAVPARDESPEPESELEPFGVLLRSIAIAEPVSAEPRAALLPDRLVGEIVRSIAWGGDRRRGAARIELGGERFSGASVTVEVDGANLRLALDAPPGVDVSDLRSRLIRRFEERGFSVTDW